jgi:hypothetical protein
VDLKMDGNWNEWWEELGGRDLKVGELKGKIGRGIGQ